MVSDFIFHKLSLFILLLYNDKVSPFFPNDAFDGRVAVPGVQKLIGSL